ncbi:NosD domain-containing protein [Clostridiaceae bacterium M8S5]|nr:NosD domain-containing protein [Clostridiaceae bacterium M8S5]
MSILVVPTDYPTIQAAVDAAHPRDTVKILPGVYTESIVVNQDDISIEATVNVFLDGVDKSKVGFLVFGKNVSIEHINIMNTFLGIMMEGDGGFLHLVYCLDNATFGIQIGANNCRVEQCKCLGNGIAGMDLGGDNNIIYNNGCINNLMAGIANSNSPLTNSILKRNDIDSSLYGFGFTLADSSGNHIIKNIITSQTGILLEASDTCIADNIMNVEKVGIQINSQNNKMCNNQIAGANNGIQVSQNNNMIHSNIINTISQTGISLLSNNNKASCNIISNVQVGIQIVGKDNCIKCNEFFNNGKNVLLSCKKYNLKNETVDEE